MWVSTTIGEMLSLDYGFGLPKSKRDEAGTVPVLGSNGECGRHREAKVKGPGIVVGRKGSAGLVNWIQNDFWPIDTTYYVTPKIKVELKWVYYLLQNLGLGKYKTSTGVPGLNRNDVYPIEVKLPPITEQRRIVEILDQADALRKQRTEADAKAARILPALFYQMFGDPATNPKGWPIVSLGEVSLKKPQYGANAKAVEYREGMPRYVRITDITDSGQLCNEDKKSLDLNEWEQYKLVETDLLFARSGATVGKTYMYREDDGLCAFAGYLIRFQLDPEKMNPWVVFAYTQTPHYKSWVAAKQRSAAQPNINGQEYAALPLMQPDRETQEQFATRMKSIHDLNQQCLDRSSKLDHLYDVMLHRAFSGELTAKWRETHMKELLKEMENQARSLGLNNNVAVGSS